jgi:hypothetical protein
MTKMSVQSHPQGVHCQSMTTSHDISARELLRHTLATVAYRGSKPLRDTPPEFATFRIATGSRTPGEILAHVCDLFDWAGWMMRGEQRWTDTTPAAWPADVARFHVALQALDDYLLSDAPLRATPDKIFQGPVADALQHIGQLAMLRRLFGSPIRGENYHKADIESGRVGPEQAAPRMEFD